MAQVLARCEHCSAEINMLGQIINAKGECIHKFGPVFAAPPPPRPSPPPKKLAGDRWPRQMEARRMEDLKYLVDMTAKQIEEAEGDLKELGRRYKAVTDDINDEFGKFKEKLEKRRDALRKNAHDAWLARENSLTELKKNLMKYKKECEDGQKHIENEVNTKEKTTKRERYIVKFANKLIDKCPKIYKIPLEITFSEAEGASRLEESIQFYGRVDSANVEETKEHIKDYKPQPKYEASKAEKKFESDEKDDDSKEMPATDEMRLMSAAAQSVLNARGSSASFNDKTGLIQIAMVISGVKSTAKEGLTVVCQVKDKSTGRVIHKEEGNALECHLSQARWKYTLKADLNSNPANHGTEILVEFKLKCPLTEWIVPDSRKDEWLTCRPSLKIGPLQSTIRDLINSQPEMTPSSEDQSVAILMDLYEKLPSRLSFFAYPEWIGEKSRVFFRDVHTPGATFESLKEVIAKRCHAERMDFKIYIREGPYMGCELTTKIEFGVVQHGKTVIGLTRKLN